MEGWQEEGIVLLEFEHWGLGEDRVKYVLCKHEDQRGQIYGALVQSRARQYLSVNPALESWMQLEPWHSVAN